VIGSGPNRLAAAIMLLHAGLRSRCRKTPIGSAIDELQTNGLGLADVVPRELVRGAKGLFPGPLSRAGAGIEHISPTASRIASSRCGRCRRRMEARRVEQATYTLGRARRE